MPATDLLPPGAGRTFTAARTVRLGDVDPSGTLRVDAIARYLQDVASDDALDAALPNALGWVVRRTLIRVGEPATVGDAVELTTYCTGAGRSWAERRTALRSGSVNVADAVSLWVQVDVATGRPVRLGDEFDRVYGEAASGRVVSSKLSLPSRPPEGATTLMTWSFRRSDLDPFGHVNNAAQLAVVEELIGSAAGRRGRIEIEYLAPADSGVVYDIVVDGPLHWLRSSSGEVVSVIGVDRA